MKVEHVAFNVEDPLSMARWYVEHLGFKVVRRSMDAPWAHFLVDSTGSTMFEIYGNTNAPIPDYHQTNVSTLHLAFVSDDVEADIRKLTAAGGNLDGEVAHTPAGDTMAFVRDPWGMTLQLVKRATPML